jgi:hypothetical protein
MIALIFFLICLQALGACIGAFAAIWGEIVYILAMRDGKIDKAERAHIRAIGHGLRWGMALLLLSSLALVIIDYTLHVSRQPALTASYWIFVVLALVVIIISWLLARKKISFVAGSAISLAAWCLLVYLTLGLLFITSFIAAMAFFVVLAVVSYAVIYYARLLASHKK